jgi:hypothetical protein
LEIGPCKLSQVPKPPAGKAGNVALHPSKALVRALPLRSCLLGFGQTTLLVFLAAAAGAAFVSAYFFSLCIHLQPFMGFEN